MLSIRERQDTFVLKNDDHVDAVTGSSMLLIRDIGVKPGAIQIAKSLTAYAE